MDYFGGKQYPWLSLAVPKLRDKGYKVEVVSWQDPSINWQSKELVVMGPVWGYSKQQKSFDAWLARMQELRVPLENSPQFIRWNFTKDYLLTLQKAGISIPPTMIVPLDSDKTLAQTIAEAKAQWGTDDIVIKGVVDAGAFGYKHINPECASPYEDDFAKLKRDNSGVVVQPFLPQIGKQGEFAFVFFGDELSHGFLKVPRPNDERVQPFYGGKSFHFRNDDIAERNDLTIHNSAISISKDEIASARGQAIEIRRKLNSLLHRKGIAPPLYVRIDGVMVNGQLQVMEIEGLEPYMEMKEAMQADPSKDVVESYARAIDVAYQRKLHAGRAGRE